MDRYDEGHADGYKEGYKEGFTDFLKEIFSGNLDGVCEDAFMEIFNREFGGLPTGLDGEYYEILKGIYKTFFSTIYKDAFEDGYLHCKYGEELTFYSFSTEVKSSRKSYEYEGNDEYDEDYHYYDDEKVQEEIRQEFEDDWRELNYVLEHGVYEDSE